MRLIDLFCSSAVKLGLDTTSKDEIIRQLVSLQTTHGNILDTDAYETAIRAREAEFSTYIGNGIVVPHAKTDAVTAPSLAVVTLKEPILWNEDDDGPANLFFMIAAPMNGNLHVDMLARMMTLLADEEFVARLHRADSAESFLQMLDQEEQRLCGDESFTQEMVPACGYRVLAVTACLSMAFGCTLQAPHGGIFVLPTIGNSLMYLVALVAGSIVAALILSAMKKRKN